MDDNFETVPFSYLRADRKLFINTQFLLQLDDVPNPDIVKGRHWYVDALAFSPAANQIYLCEFTFSQSLQGLKKRLQMWRDVWAEIGVALIRDAGVPPATRVRPWAFLPESSLPAMVDIASAIGFDGTGVLPAIKLTSLEMTLPWKYRFWKREGEAPKPSTIPSNMV